MDSRYVLITYSVIPRDNKITGIKGWRDIPNATQFNESIGFKNNIKTNDLQTAKMILDRLQLRQSCTQKRQKKY